MVKSNAMQAAHAVASARSSRARVPCKAEAPACNFGGKVIRAGHATSRTQFMQVLRAWRVPLQHGANSRHGGRGSGQRVSRKQLADKPRLNISPYRGKRQMGRAAAAVDASDVVVRHELAAAARR
jgi:hypothetical protein